MPVSTYPVQRGVTWLTPGDLIDYLSTGQAAKPQVTSTQCWANSGGTDANPMVFNFNLPVVLGAQALKITDLTLYYYTGANAYYITAVELREVNPTDGSLAKKLLDFTTDLGNGTSGNASAALLAAPITVAMTAGGVAGFPNPHIFVLWLVTHNDGATYGDIRVYGIRVTWEATG